MWYLMNYTVNYPVIPFGYLYLYVRNIPIYVHYFAYFFENSDQDRKIWYM